MTEDGCGRRLFRAFTVTAAVAVFITSVAASAAADDAKKMGSEMMNPGLRFGVAEVKRGGGMKVLVYGNSIALHGPKADIGWKNRWGMAASAAEKDFAHLLAADLEARCGKPVYLRIRNLAPLERKFTTPIAAVPEIAADAAWGADFVVIAIGENAPKIDAGNAAAYRKFLADLARPFSGSAKRPKIVMRSPFWHNPVKAECTANAAADVGAVYVDAGPLGFRKENKAIGRFKHKGVANHPGDLGMRRLADLILAGFDAAEENPVAEAKVTFAGKDLNVERCRVSAVPFNRIWPGCQRSMDQTRLSAFAGFDVPRGGGTLELDFGKAVPETARIRPFSRVQPVRKGSVWSVRIDRPEQFVMEFSGGGELHVFADPPWEDVPDGPDVIRFKPGVHRPGAIIPKSGTTIVVERGAVVHGNFVLAGVEDVKITGRGIVDGSTLPRIDHGYPGVRYLASCTNRWYSVCGSGPVFAVDGKRLEIEGVTFLDAGRWAMNIVRCDDVKVRNVKLVGMWRYNADGVDFCSSKNVELRDSFIRSFDDCVVARPPFSGMAVSNCVLWCDWGHNMKVQHSTVPSVMENISFTDIKAIGVEGLITSVTTRYGSGNCTIRNVAFRDIEADVPPERPLGRMQARDAWKYVPRYAEGLELLRIYSYGLGKPTPNDGKPIPVDEDKLRILYENIEMRDVRVFQAPGRRVDERSPYPVSCSIRKNIRNFTVRDVRFSGLPKCTKIVEDPPEKPQTRTGGPAAPGGAKTVKRVDAPARSCDWDIWTLRKFNDATPLLQGAIDDVFRSGGGRVNVGRGFYPVKGLRLRSGVTLYLENGAVLQASRESADFDILGKDRVEPVDPAAYAEGRRSVWTPPRGAAERTCARPHIGNVLSPWHDAVIRILNARDVAIIGEKGSVIDGANGFNPAGEEKYRGVHGISAHYSTNIVLRGFTVQHTGNWAMNLRYCADIVCDGVTALGGHDGFHVRGCDRIRVEDCVFHTGDDSVAGFDNRDMVVRGCDLSSACSAFRLGGRDILIENCRAHGPCEYLFRGSLCDQSKRDGLWDPAIVPGRQTMATFFLYLCDYTMPVRHQPGNIVVRNCTVENAARFMRYNYGGETWQHARPLADIRFENVKASGMWRPVAMNAGSFKAGDLPLAFTMENCSLSFAKPQPEVFSALNVRTIALTNVTVSGVSCPLVRTWDGRPELKLSGVRGVRAEIADGSGEYRCPMR